MILDTTVLVDLMRGRKEAIQKVTAVVAAGIPTVVTTPSVFELFNGITQSSQQGKETERVHRTLHQLTCWSLDRPSAEMAGRLLGELARKGQLIDEVDALIAGIALSRHEPVLTRNAKHFSRVPGLRVETY